MEDGVQAIIDNAKQKVEENETSAVGPITSQEQHHGGGSMDNENQAYYFCMPIEDEWRRQHALTFFVYSLFVLLSTILSIVCTLTSTWAISDLDPRLASAWGVPGGTITSIQFGPVFYCIRNSVPSIYDGINVSCNINFVDTSDPSGAWGFNAIRGCSILTSVFALTFFVSFFNKRAFYEYRATILVFQMVAALMTIIFWESYGEKDIEVDKLRNYVWATYKDADAQDVGVGYLGFIIVNLICPLIYLLITKACIDTSSTQMRKNDHKGRACTRRTCTFEGFHAFSVILVTCLYLYCATSSKWSRNNDLKNINLSDATGIDGDTSVRTLSDLVTRHSLAFLLRPTATGQPDTAEWGEPDFIEQGPFSTCLHFKDFIHCHADVSGSEDRIRNFSVIRSFMIFGIASAVFLTFMSISRWTEETTELHIFAYFLLPFMNVLCTVVATAAWASAGSKDYISNYPTDDGLWSKGQLGYAWYLLLVFMVFYIWVILYYAWMKDRYFTGENNIIQGCCGQEEDYDDVIGRFLPSDPYWCFYKEPEVEEKYSLDPNDWKYWVILLSSVIGFVLMITAAIQEWTLLKVTDPDETYEIFTYLFGYQCVKVKSNDYTDCDDILKFSGTKTRMNRMQTVMSLYFAGCSFMLWGLYEHIRNRMHPLRRMGWFAGTFLVCAFSLGIFWGCGDDMDWKQVSLFLTMTFPPNPASVYTSQFADIYAGLDITYMTDVLNVPINFEADPDQHYFFLCFVGAVLLMLIAVMTQVYWFMYTVKTEILRKQGDVVTELTVK